LRVLFSVATLCLASLRKLRLNVTIYSERKVSETTSSKAGGQWAVSVIEFNGKKQELGQILRTAYTTFKNSIGKGFGVSERPNDTATRSHNLDAVLQLAPGLIPEPVHLSRLPFEGHTSPGFEYQTLLIEPPIFLPRLEADLKARGVPFVSKKFANKTDILTSLSQKIIINCTGLGAKILWNDLKVVPLKGQLAMLPAQPNLQYLYGQNGYMFPRADHVVIGGTFDHENDEIPNKAVCQDLMRHIASLFGKAPSKPLPANHIHHPDHAPVVNPAIPSV
jgi:D-amino-acid oxidase